MTAEDMHAAAEYEIHETGKAARRAFDDCVAEWRDSMNALQRTVDRVGRAAVDALGAWEIRARD